MVEGPFSEVEALLRAGRVKEAASALKRSAAAGAAPWEMLIWMGRIEEKSGRLERAERTYRKAAEADPKAAPELLRLLEEPKYVDYRRALLAETLRTGDGLEPLEASIRASLRGEAPGPGARTLPVEMLLQLIDGGRYAPETERALLDGVARAGAGDKLSTEWPQIFSALMCARLYPQAFRLGEAVLDAHGRFESPGQLMWPWWRMIRRAVAEDRFVALELGRMRAAGESGEFPHWYAYYRAILLSDQGRNGDAMAEYEKLKPLDSDRYSWMWQSFVLVKLGEMDFDGAIAISRDILSRAPSHWWVRCRMAEAYLARGDAERGLREFEEAGRTCGPGLKGEVLTWHGEVLLWLGDYAGALEKLDAAVALGAKTFVFGWRGAARMKLGDREGALADLDRAVALDPKDFEARGWRAEARRLMGRDAEALLDVEHVIGHGPKNFWAHINRALLRDAAGDARGMAEDFAEAPEALIALVEKRLKMKKGRRTRARMRAILTAGLDWAKGVRRWENFVQPIWMERPT
ncbi:MAG: tetratricopeptide repeat protein [Elusimicrobia bacterium]|nr:tetratricopeptide repeat protein [Elusimicrobiota bacterium]